MKKDRLTDFMAWLYSHASRARSPLRPAGGDWL